MAQALRFFEITFCDLKEAYSPAVSCKIRYWTLVATASVVAV